jgi:pimeloyl-ACP methyl ester carboxylesterase
MRGHLSYVGQLEDDFADLLQLLNRRFPDARRVLVGHSAGGGFALRIAGLPLATRFDGLVLMAPFLGVDAPTTKPHGGWASVGVGRLLGLQAVGKLGIHAFDHLPVLSFAVSPEVASSLTPRYSFRLMQNFGPNADWRRDVLELRLPTAVLVGSRDELFHADRFIEVFGHKAEVRVLDEIDHMGITAEPVALRSLVEFANRLPDRSNAVVPSNR